MPTKSTIEHHTSALLDGLRHEFSGQFDPNSIDAVGYSHYARLTRGARVLDYIPVLVYRATKDDLIATHSTGLSRAQPGRTPSSRSGGSARGIGRRARRERPARSTSNASRTSAAIAIAQ
jgi:hypothetical protein